jgi:hypothetical protein
MRAIVEATGAAWDVMMTVEQGPASFRGTVHSRPSLTASLAFTTTTFQQHAGDMPLGTLQSIAKDLEPVFGKGWLL